MSKKKLTLSVEDRLTRRAKVVAENRGTSVSRLVETFFASLDDAGAEHAAEQEANDDADRTASADGGPDDRALSAWAQRWRGAFKEPGHSYPDDPDWEKELLAEEIGDKHA